MVLIAVISPEGLLLKINKAWETVLGYPQEQLLDQPFIQLIHPDDVAATLSQMSRLNKLEDLVGYINRYRCQDGSYRHMEWNAQMREGHIYAIARDVTDRVNDKQLLQTEHERFEQAIWGSNDGIWDWDLVAGTVYLSPRWKEQLGYSDQELANEPDRFISLLHPDDRDRVTQRIEDCLQRRTEAYEAEFRLRHKDGQYRWIQARGKAFWTEAGQAYRITGAHNVFELANYGLSINELDGTTLYINPYFARIHGYEPEELVGQKLNLFHTPRQLVQVSRLIQKIIEAGGFQAEEVWHVDRWGQEFPMLMTGTYMEGDMERGQKPYMAATSIDIREIKAKEAEILYLNQHDPLTGLMNRNALNQLTVQDHHGDGNLVQSVLFINIDKFKLVNDVLGHQAGDNLLVQLADRIVALVGDQERVYRIGGDEFLILVPSLDLDELSALAKSIQQLIGRQIDIHQSAVLITASQGICIGKPGLSLEQTITRAETALYQAKKKRNAIAVYHDSMERARTRDVLLELDLQSALEQNQFELFYQPIFNVHTGRIDQAEALLRWNHPVFGRIPPLDFIPIAERTRLIIPITDWVIRQACSKITEWSELGLEGLMVSVNLSILSIENRGEELVDFIGSAIRASGISPSRLKLEITESTLVNDLDEIVSVFQKLKQLGVKLALDDFGTGYSSFGYMKDLPLDIMKLDRSLIGNIAVSEKEQMIVGSMVTIIHGLGLEVVIEGVETKEQLDSIMKFDCDYIQGYYFSKPLPPDEFVRYFFSVTEEFREAFLSTYPALHSQVHLDWQEDWASGNPQLDRQHQDLMQDANRLLHLALDGTDQARLIQELDVLLRHVTDHFSYEEEVMGTSGYPDLLAHRREHERLVQEIHQLRQRYTQKQVRPTVFFSFLVDQVILGHLVDEDAKYFRWTRPPA